MPSERLERLRALAREPLHLPPEGLALLDAQRTQLRSALRLAGGDTDETARLVVDVGLSTLEALSAAEDLRARWVTTMALLLFSSPEDEVQEEGHAKG